MKNNVFTIMKKEFARFFGDKRLVITTLILPGLLIYLMYSFMGDGMTDMFSPTEGKTCVMYSVNTPSIIESVFSGDDAPIKIVKGEKLTSDEIRATIKGDTDIYAVFPENFDEYISSFESGVSLPLEIEIFFDSTDADSTTAYETINSVLLSIENSLANVYNVNSREI